MKKYSLSILLLLSSFVGATNTPTPSSNLFLIDGIDTVVYGPQETAIITKSEVNRSGLDGTLRTRDKVVFELLVFQDAKKYRVVDDEMIDKYIASVQSEHNLSLDELKKMFRDAGYTYEQGREQLSILQMVNSMLDFKIRSKLIIPENEVKAFYDANPLYAPEAYQLQRIFVPFIKPAVTADVKTSINVPDASREMQKAQIEKGIKLGQQLAGAEYSDQFLVQKDDLADDKKFITQMTSGQISSPQQLDDGFEMFKLAARQERELISLDVRYKAIADKLREPLYEKLFEEYKKTLFANSVVVSFDEKK